jgi:hypothetical protein
MRIDVTLEAREAIRGVDCAVVITAQDGTRLIDEAWSDRHPDLLTFAAGDAVPLRLDLAPVLASGWYELALWVGTAYGVMFEDRVAGFAVEPRLDDTAEQTKRVRVLQPDVSWSIAAPTKTG